MVLPPVLRVVVDTSVIASAWRSRNGASAALLRVLELGSVIGLATTPLFLEYEDVLKRADQRLVSGLALPHIDELLSELAALIEPVNVNWRWRPQLPDPGDEFVLEAAINGRADVIATYNIRDFAAAGPRFGVRVLRPAELLRELAHESGR